MVFNLEAMIRKNHEVKKNIKHQQFKLINVFYHKSYRNQPIIVILNKKFNNKNILFVKSKLEKLTNIFLIVIKNVKYSALVNYQKHTNFFSGGFFLSSEFDSLF